MKNKMIKGKIMKVENNKPDTAELCSHLPAVKAPWPISKHHVSCFL